MNRGTRRSAGWLGLVWMVMLVLMLVPVSAAWAQGSAPKASGADEASPAEEGTERLLVVRGARLVHRSTCTTLRRVRPAQRVEVPSLDAARTQGYQPCVVCKPDVGGGPAEATGGDGAAATGEGPLRFSQEIAPILVANCANCHNPQDKARRNNFDLTTFSALRRGGDAGDPIVSGKPEESLLIKHVQGDGVPKMPPGQRDLAEATIAKLSRWISEGARLDAGIGPEAQLSSYAPTAEQLRRTELSRLSAEDRDKQVETASLERWKKSGAEAPTLTAGTSVLLFSQLPKERAEALVRVLDAQWAAVRSLLGPVGSPVLSGPEKVSVYVFNDPLRYIELVRSVENREVETGAQAHGNLSVPAPYLAAIDPLKGGAEPAASTKSARSRASARGQAESGFPASESERSLAGLLCEALGSQAVQVSGKPPRWLVLGMGAYMASQIEPRSPYFAGLRRETMELYRTGWMTRVTEVLGDRDSAELARAAGFSLLEWLGTTWRPTMPPIVRELTRDGTRFDAVFQSQLRANRGQVLQAWGGFVATRYGRGR